MSVELTMCPTCDGRAWISPQGDVHKLKPCPTCEGTGRVAANVERMAYSPSASSNCSAAGIERERHLVLVLEEITALICYQPEFPSKHKEDLIDRLKGFKAASAAAQQQNGQADRPAGRNSKTV